MMQREARDEAIARASWPSAAWRSFAARALYECARQAPSITSNDVWAVLHERDVPDPGEPRAMGAVMLQGVHRNWIQATDRMLSSERSASANHMRPQRVYLSLIEGRLAIAWPPVPTVEPVVSPLRTDALLALRSEWACINCGADAPPDRTLTPTISQSVSMGRCGNCNGRTFRKRP